MNLDFNNHVLGHLYPFGIKVEITETVFYMWIICALLIIFSIVVRLSLKNFQQVPKGFQNFVEVIVDAFRGFSNGSIGEKYDFIGSWYFGVFAFILLSNISGLVGFRPPTADLTITLMFAFETLFCIHFFGAVLNTKSYFKGYFEPVPFFLPLNIVSEIAIPISLSFRLFGNILGGMIMMGILYAALPMFVRWCVPSVLHIYFDMFAGCLQSFIFCILSLTFIRQKLPD